MTEILAPDAFLKLAGETCDAETGARLAGTRKLVDAYEKLHKHWEAARTEAADAQEGQDAFEHELVSRTEQWEEALAEVQRLREAIEKHRDENC